MERFIRSILCVLLIMFITVPQVSAEECIPVVYLNGAQVDDTDVVLVDNIVQISVQTYLDYSGFSYEYTYTNGVYKFVGKTAAGIPYYVQVKEGTKYAIFNGRYFYIGMTSEVCDNKVYLPAGMLTKFTNGQYIVDSKDSNIQHITTGIDVLASGDQYYNEDVVYLLGRVIYSEAGNQCLEGKIAVGNVVMNRYKSASFPNNILDIVYADNQFDGVRTDNFNATPTESCIVAARIALEGQQMVPGALYFNTKGLDSWAHRTKTYLGTIQGHDFYA